MNTQQIIEDITHAVYDGPEGGKTIAGMRQSVRDMAVVVTKGGEARFEGAYESYAVPIIKEMFKYDEFNLTKDKITVKV